MVRLIRSNATTVSSSTGYSLRRFFTSMMGLRVPITDSCPSIFAIVFFASPIRRLTRLICDRVYTVSPFFASLRGTPRDSQAQPRDSQVQIQRKVLSACHDVRRSVLLVLKDMRMENIISQQLTASGDVLYGTSPLGTNAIQHDVATIAQLRPRTSWPE